jgi:NitT/TauT family transport system substrate-binding protein
LSHRPIADGEGGGLSRGALLRRAAAAGVGVSVAGGLGGLLSAEPARGAGLDKVTWVSPLGTLEVMNFYNLVVADKMGYFKANGIESKLAPGAGGTTVVTYVAQHLGDIGGAAPAFLAYAVDKNIPVYSIWEWYPACVFDFAVPADSKIRTLKQLEGKTIALHNDADDTVANPVLLGAGVDISKIKYVTFGEVWAQATARHQADAALVWEGLRGQLIGQGVKLRYLIGAKVSNQPSNVYAVRKADLKDPKKHDIYKRWLKAAVMGLEFARGNPRAAGQITYDEYPSLHSLIKPKLALESMMELGTGFGVERRRGLGWGYHDPKAWQSYLDVVHKLKQTKRHLKVADVLTNQYVKPVNKEIDAVRANVWADARKYKLDKAWAALKVPKYPL